VQPRPSVPSHLWFSKTSQQRSAPFHGVNTRRTSTRGCPVTQSAAPLVAEPTKHLASIPDRRGKGFRRPGIEATLYTCFSGGHQRLKSGSLIFAATDKRVV